MEIHFTKAPSSELATALNFFKLASRSLESKNVSQWSYWQNPPKDKVNWVKEGFEKKEFYFVKDRTENTIGMFRLLETDTLYWGDTGLEDNVRYLHSLVVIPSFAGLGLGKAILYKLIENLKNQTIAKFRLDCDASNEKLCDYYQSYGFVKVGEKLTKYSINNLYELSLS